MRKIKDFGIFGIGVVSHSKDKIYGKVRRWKGIIQNPNLRRSWETGITERGEETRQSLVLHLQKAIDKIGFKSSSNSRPRQFRIGESVNFYALDCERELTGVITTTGIDHNHAYFLVRAKSNDGREQIYICKDCGHIVIGDSEL